RIARHARQHARLAAGRDDALIEVERLARAVAVDLEPVRGCEERRAAHDANLSLLRERVEPAGELAHDAVLPVAQLQGVDLWFPKRQAVRAHLARLFEHARRMQQRLRW